MKRDDFVDFFVVHDHHLELHGRLEMWARWVKVRPSGWQVQPMFRYYRPPQEWRHRSEPRLPVNIPEAMEMEEAVRALDPKQRDAIRWLYVSGRAPVAMARTLEVGTGGLMALVHAGRAALLNRGA